MAKRKKSLKRTLGKAALKVKHGATGIWNKMTTLKPSKQAQLPDDDYMQTDDMNTIVKRVKKTKEFGPKPAIPSGKLGKIKAVVNKFRKRFKKKSTLSRSDSKMLSDWQKGKLG